MVPVISLGPNGRLVLSEGVMEDERPTVSSGMTGEDNPDWWSHAAEFPHWHVWRGICGLVYARRPRSSPPLVVRAANPVDLLAQIRRAEDKTP